MALTRPKTEPRETRAADDGPLSAEEEQRLARRWRTLEDAAALARLVQAHLGLVIHIANEYRHSGPSMEDLIQEGNLGLTVAARRFDPTKATRLATYATYWIRAFMMEHVVRSHGPVRIGTTRSQRKIFFGLGRARRRLECTGRAATAEALAGELGVEREDIESMSPRLSGRDVSLDAPRSVDDGREVGALLSEEGPSPEDLVAGLEEEDTRRERLHAGLRVLDPRERAIIKARHLCARPVTLGALGRRMGISRERVRQIELRAVAKLRSFCGVSRLHRKGASVTAEGSFSDEGNGSPFERAARPACGVLSLAACPAR
jgi:RNA polymerase sigma-32 factor